MRIHKHSPGSGLFMVTPFHDVVLGFVFFTGGSVPTRDARIQSEWVGYFVEMPHLSELLCSDSMSSMGPTDIQLSRELGPISSCYQKMVQLESRLHIYTSLALNFYPDEKPCMQVMTGADCAHCSCDS